MLDQPKCIDISALSRDFEFSVLIEIMGMALAACLVDLHQIKVKLQIFLVYYKGKCAKALEDGNPRVDLSFKSCSTIPLVCPWESLGDTVIIEPFRNALLRGVLEPLRMSVEAVLHRLKTQSECHLTGLSEFGVDGVHLGWQKPTSDI